MAKEPYVPEIVSASKLLSPASTSVAVIVPLTVAVSSEIVFVVSPEIVGTSFVPFTVSVISCVVPSAVVTVMVSVKLSPTPNACTALSVLSKV